MSKESERRRQGRWFRDFQALFQPFLKSEHRLRIQGYGAGIVIATGLSVFGMFELNLWFRRFFEALPQASPRDYWELLARFGAISLALITATGLGSLLKYRLRLTWREWMTERLMASWLADQRHCFWKLTQKDTDNPDQRIAEDILTFVNSSVNLAFDAFERALTLICFIGILLNLPANGATNSGPLVWTAFAYALAFNALVVWFGKNIIVLQVEQQHREADFRFSLMRIRENSEPISFSRGEKTELRHSLGLFAGVVANYRELIRKYIQVEVLENLHRQLRWILPYFLTAPQFMSGEFGIGVLIQIGNAFERVENSISFFVTSFKPFADWRASMRRLTDLQESLHRSEEVKLDARARALPRTAPLEAPDWSLQGVSLLSPTGRILMQDLSFEAFAGDRILLQGPSGSGKSTLLRVLARNWPFFSGEVVPPSFETSLFLPQVPYLPAGSLREVLLYPGEAGGPDSLLQTYLEELGLKHLCDSLSAVEDWTARLSPGERQRLVLVRAFLRKPSWLFLDEATSSMDEAHQDLAYRLLLERLPHCGILSISHDSRLKRFHRRFLSTGLKTLAPVEAE